MLAAVNGRAEVVDILIAAKANVNLIDQNGESALMWAARVGNIEIVNSLLNAGADVNLITNHGGTALMCAAVNRHTEVVDILIAANADVNLINQYGASALMLAAHRGHAEVVKSLIKAKADVNLIDQNGGDSALMSAAGNGHIEVFNLLLDEGAEVNYANRWGCNALHSAARAGNIEIVNSLIVAGVDVNLITQGRESALYYAAHNGRAEIVNSLIEAGADVNLITQNGESALMSAARYGHAKVVKSLIEAKADVNLINQYGTSALIYAAMNSHAEVVNSLILAGADINFVIKKGFYVGKTAIEAVATNPNINENKKQKIFIKLFEVGADLRPEFFKDDAISDNMKDFAREHNTPEKIAERDKNLQDIFKKSILAGQPITFRDNVVDKVLLNALKSITADDLGNASKENVIKLRRSGVYSLLKIEEHLNDKEFSLSAKNLKDFKAISDKAPFVRSFNKLDEDMMSKILMHSLMPNSLGKDLTLKIINQIKILTAPANRSNPPLVPPNNSDGKSARLLDPHQHSAQAPNTPTSTPNFQSSITNPVVTEQLVFTPATDVNTRSPTPSILHENPSSSPEGSFGANAAEAVAKTAGLNDSRN